MYPVIFMYHRIRYGKLKEAPFNCMFLQWYWSGGYWEVGSFTIADTGESSFGPQDCWTLLTQGLRQSISKLLSLFLVKLFVLFVFSVFPFSWIFAYLSSYRRGDITFSCVFSVVFTTMSGSGIQSLKQSFHRKLMHLLSNCHT